MLKMSLCLLYCLAAALISSASQAEDAVTSENIARLSIGVRSEVRPFAYKLPDHVIDSDATIGPLSHAGYGGYMVRICDAVLAEMLVPILGGGPTLRLEDVAVYDLDQKAYAKPEEQSDIAIAPTTGSKHIDLDKSTPAQSRFKKLGVNYDILCDPATITNGQRQFAVSPPLFLSGIGYLSLANVALPNDPCGDKDPPSEQEKVATSPSSETSETKKTRSPSRPLSGLSKERRPEISALTPSSRHGSCRNISRP